MIWCVIVYVYRLYVAPSVIVLEECVWQALFFMFCFFCLTVNVATGFMFISFLFKSKVIVWI